MMIVMMMMMMMMMMMIKTTMVGMMLMMMMMNLLQVCRCSSCFMFSLYFLDLSCDDDEYDAEFVVLCEVLRPGPLNKCFL